MTDKGKKAAEQFQVNSEKVTQLAQKLSDDLAGVSVSVAISAISMMLSQQATSEKHLRLLTLAINNGVWTMFDILQESAEDNQQAEVAQN